MHGTNKCVARVLHTRVSQLNRNKLVHSMSESTLATAQISGTHTFVSLTATALAEK
jgi:hypothetical protein